MSLTATPPVPAPTAARAGLPPRRRPAIAHIACPDLEVGLCGVRARPGAPAAEAGAEFCVVCLALSKRPTCPECGGHHRLPPGGPDA